MLIGWWWGSVPLGLFERAQKLLQQPIQNLNIPLATVALPTLSRLTMQPESYRSSYIGVVCRLTMLMAPISALMIAAAGPVVALVLGPQWSGAAPVLAWMGVSVVCMPVTYSLSWLYMSQDRTREMLRAGLVNSGIGVAALAAGLPFGIAGVAIAYTASVIVVRGPVLFWLVGRHGPVRIADSIGFCWRRRWPRRQGPERSTPFVRSRLSIPGHLQPRSRQRWCWPSRRRSPSMAYFPVAVAFSAACRACRPI